MQGPVFSAPFLAIASTQEVDIFDLVAPSSGRVRILEVSITQHSEAGDAAAELLPLQYLRGSTAAGTGGTAITPVNHKGVSRASEATVTVMNATTLASTTSAVRMKAESFNVQAGYLDRPFKDGLEHDECIHLNAGERFVVRCGAPADSVTFNGTIRFQELGKYSG